MGLHVDTTAYVFLVFVMLLLFVFSAFVSIDRFVYVRLTHTVVNCGDCGVVNSIHLRVIIIQVQRDETARDTPSRTSEES